MLEVDNMVRSLRVLFAVGVMACPFAMATAAMAQTCPILDPTCTVNEVIDNGSGAADDVVGNSGDAVDDPAGAAGDAVDTARGTVDDTVSKVQDTVDRTLGGSGNPPPGDGGGSDPGGGHGGGNGAGQGPANGPGSTNGGQHNGAGSGRGGGHVGSVGASATSNPTGPASGFQGITPVGPQDRGTASTFAQQVATGIVAGAALMALLLGGVAAFLTIQDRLDRRDPKLLPASIGSDRVQFT